VRVDKYWCHSTLLATQDIESPGLKFVTIFCDEQRVPLPPKMTNVLASFAEQSVPDLFQRLVDVAKDVEAKKSAESEH